MKLENLHGFLVGAGDRVCGINQVKMSKTQSVVFIMSVHALAVIYDYWKLRRGNLKAQEIWWTAINSIIRMVAGILGSQEIKPLSYCFDIMLERFTYEIKSVPSKQLPSC